MESRGDGSMDGIIVCRRDDVLSDAPPVMVGAIMRPPLVRAALNASRSKSSAAATHQMTKGRRRKLHDWYITSTRLVIIALIDSLPTMMGEGLSCEACGYER